MSRRGPQPPAPEVALRDGDLYVMDGNDIGDKIIATDGKIDRYMVSPDKLYVACSVIIGYADEPGIYEDGEEPSQRPLHKITITDLKRKKQLREILAPSENDPFFYLTDWISDSELMLTDSDGFAVSWSYVYNVETNELRKASIEEMNLEK
jgi:hypothetical protein